MPKEKVLNKREFVKVLKDNGYSYKRSSGDHDIYSNGRNIIPVNIKPNRMVMKRMVKIYNLSI